jgi:MFS family permease
MALLLPFALQGAGIAFGPATANLLVTSATGEHERAIGFSANSFMARIGGFAFPVVIGFAIATGGYPWMFITAAALGAAGLLALSVAANSLGLWQQHAGAVANL